MEMGKSIMARILSLFLIFLTTIASAEIPCVYGTAKSSTVILSNLVTYSEQFDNVAWTKTRTAVTANSIIAPDGTTTADMLTANVGSSTTYSIYSALVTTVASSVYRMSIYLRKGTAQYVKLRSQGPGTAGVGVNLSTGVIGFVDSSVINSSIASVGNGWYLVTMEYAVAGASDYLTFHFTDSSYNNTWSAAGTETVYVWGGSMQLVSSPADYLRTTSAALSLAGVCSEGYAKDPNVFGGCIEVVPSKREIRTAEQITAAAGIVNDCGSRIGFTSRAAISNLTKYSEQFDNAAWTKSNITVTANDATAPDGTATADKLTAGATASAKYMYPTASMATITNGATYRFSVYVKKGNQDYIQFYYQGSSSVGINVDLSTGTVPFASTSIIDHKVESVGSGWYRIYFTVVATNTILYPSFNLIKSATTAIGTAETTSGTEYWYVWGTSVQLLSNYADYSPAVAANISISPTCGLGLTPAKFNPGACVSVFDMSPEIRTPTQISGG